MTGDDPTSLNIGPPRNVRKLAIFSGSPAFTEALHVGRPNIGDRGKLLNRVHGLLDRRWLSNSGPLVQEFEQQIAARMQVRNCIATCNATIALEIAIRSLDLSGRVIVPAFTFVATAHALWWQGITPVFCDIDANTHTLDPTKVESMLAPDVTGILGVHLWGRACDVDALARIARENNLKLLFDAAHAFGCTHQGRMIGGFGDAEVYSFHATKFINSFEGGAVVTNDDRLAERIRSMRNFGFANYDEVVGIGTNGKMCEAAAAMGLTSLESMDVFAEVNRTNFELYRRGLADLPGVHLIQYDERETLNYHYVIAEIDTEMAGISRDILLKILWAENVIARRYFYPGCHRMEPYRTLLAGGGAGLPETDRMARRVLALPTGTAVGAHEVAGICEIVRTAVCNAPEVMERLADR